MRKNLVRLGVIVSAALAAVGCASAPKAPTLSGSNRVPLNNQTAVELQSCKGDLSNTKILLRETSRLADSASSALSQMTRMCAAPRVAPTSIEPAAVTFTPAAYRGGGEEQPRSTVFVLHFPYASTVVDLSDDSAIALADAAKNSQLIVIRGRTDGVVDTLGETRVAKARAEAVTSYLTALGIDPAHIRATFQPVGDHIANNETEEGRAKNRRAEVEVYSRIPEHRELISKVTR